MFTRFTSAPFMPSRRRARAIAIAACMTGLVLSSASAGTIFTVSGTLSGSYPASAEARFVCSGTTLTLTLHNTSTTAPTQYPAQVLTSFYFDLQVNGGIRPELTYVSGSGNVFKIIGNGGTAQPYVYTPPVTSGTAFQSGTGLSNLMASGTAYDTWYFRNDLNANLPPGTHFGIGTVGNSTLDPNNFNAQYVDQIDFGIFSGDLTNPQGNLKPGSPGLNYPYLVKDEAVFMFYADQDIDAAQFLDPYVFGFGTNPDQTITIVPEPGAIILAGFGGAGCLLILRRRRARQASRQHPSSGALSSQPPETRKHINSLTPALSRKTAGRLSHRSAPRCDWSI